MDRNVMDDKAILKEAIKERGMKQKTLAEQLGVAQNALSANMTRDRMGLDNFKKILNVLGYDVVVVDRESGELKWTVDPDR